MSTATICTVDWQAVAGFANAAAVVGAAGTAFFLFTAQRRFDAKYAEAVEALKLVREARTVIADIRSPAIFAGENDELEKVNGRELKGMDAHYAATMYRLHRKAEFFQRLDRSEVAIAVHFGENTAEGFRRISKIRRDLFAMAVSAAGIYENENVADFIARAKRTIWRDWETPDAITTELDSIYERLRRDLSDVVPIPREKK